MAPQTIVRQVTTKQLNAATEPALEIRALALEHMLAAVARTPAESQPFPHFFVEGLLPDDLYRELIASLPDERLYQAFSYSKHATNGQSNRGRFGLTSADLDGLHGRQQWLWRGVRDALGSAEFKSAVFERLSEGLAYRLGIAPREAAATPGYPLPELFRETAGYEIKPHPDTRRKLVTMQVSLAADDGQRGMGTEFYRRSLNPLAMLREPRGFDVVKRMPFVPNAAYAFVVLNTLRLKSWHGRTRIDGRCGVRNSILNIWYARPEDGNPELG
jgi:hypothetical protein